MEKVRWCYLALTGCFVIFLLYINHSGYKALKSDGKISKASKNELKIMHDEINYYIFIIFALFCVSGQGIAIFGYVKILTFKWLILIVALIFTIGPVGGIGYIVYCIFADYRKWIRFLLEKAKKDELF